MRESPFTERPPNPPNIIDWDDLTPDQRNEACKLLYLAVREAIEESLEEFYAKHGRCPESVEVKVSDLKFTERDDYGSS